MRAAAVIAALSTARTVLVDFVRSRMHEIAPNAAAIVGHASAAELLSAAGGIAKLAALPSNIIATLGHKFCGGEQKYFWIFFLYIFEFQQERQTLHFFYILFLTLILFFPLSLSPTLYRQPRGSGLSFFVVRAAATGSTGWV
jgi:hypothetical protein